MKKFMLFVLALVFIGTATTVYADHAKLMPVDVGRVYFAPSHISGFRTFNDDGDRKFGTPVEMFNMGMALEHGVLPWLTGALQWTPGINIQSNVGNSEGKDAQDMGDLFIGAKMQFIGNTALLMPSDDMRLSIALGVKAPLTKGPDFDKEYQNGKVGDDATMTKIDKHVWAAGWRFYFDYLVTKEFFINFYNQTMIYVQKGKYKHWGYGQSQVVDGVNTNSTMVATSSGVNGGDVDYKYDLIFEIEPNYTWEFTPKTTIEFGLPITYNQTPAPEYEFTGYGTLATNAVTNAETNIKTNNLAVKSQSITVKPTIGLFFMSWAVPIEFKVGYFIPVWGKNASANNTLSTQVRVYYKI